MAREGTHERREGSNAEIVRRLYAVFNEGGSASELLDPQIEYVNPPDAVESGTRHGTREWGAALRNIREGFGEPVVRVVRLFERGDLVATVIRMRIHGPLSGIKGEMTQSHLWTIRDGRGVRFEWFNDAEEAFRALESRSGP